MVYVNPYLGVEGLCPKCGDEGLYWRSEEGVGDVLYCRCGCRCGTEEEMVLRVLRRLWLNWGESLFMRKTVEEVARCVKAGDMRSYVRFMDVLRRGLFDVRDSPKAYVRYAGGGRGKRGGGVGGLSSGEDLLLSEYGEGK